MWNKTKVCITLSLLAALCFCSPCVGSCSQAADGETVTVLKTDWEKLKRNNIEQRKALEECNRLLSEERTVRNESDKALTEARALLENSQMTSDEMMQKLISLLNESSMQKAEIERLKAELRTAKSESTTAYDAILKANQYLNDTKAEIEAQRAEWQKREAQLERQRLEWQILFALAVGGGIALAS